MLSKWRKSIEEEAGIATGTVVLLVAGFAAVAIIASLWIGNTTAGLAADTANCVSRVNSGVDSTCMTNSATGAGGGNAMAADNSRPLGPKWMDDFGAGSGLYDIPKLNNAAGNLERGILRFSGLKSSLYSDVQTSLTKLRNATTKDAALVALQELRTTMYAAQRDGETSTSNSTIQVAANLLNEIKHPAAGIAQEAQRNAQQGNQAVSEAYATVGGGMDNYSSMTLAQLKGLAPSVDASLKNADNLYKPAVAGLNEAIANVKANR